MSFCWIKPVSIELIVIGCVSALTLYLTNKKQKQDLWSLRFNFYIRAKSIWGWDGFFQYYLVCYNAQKALDNYQYITSEKAFSPGYLEDIKYLKGEVNANEHIMRKKFPQFISDNDFKDYVDFLNEIEESRFLFGQKLCDYLMNLLPFGANLDLQDPYIKLKEAWKHAGTRGEISNFTLQFDSFLLLEKKSYWDRFKEWRNAD